MGRPKARWEDDVQNGTTKVVFVNWSQVKLKVKCSRYRRGCDPEGG